MKGMVFREFFDMVEAKFSIEMVDDIIESASPNPETGYASVGTYPHEELLSMVDALGQKTSESRWNLLYIFGKELFKRFTVLHPDFVVNHSSAFSFLEAVDGFIHLEVKKVIPEADTPTVQCIRGVDDRKLSVEYKSHRPFAALALGLIEGCSEHFQNDMKISYELCGDGNETHAIFHLELV